MIKTLSRQRRRQLELVAQGLCQSCGCKRSKDDPLFCEKDRAAHNESSRNHYYTGELKGGIRKRVFDGDLEGLNKRQISRAKNWLKKRGYIK